jgi:T-complex protein 1 subunit theta
LYKSEVFQGMVFKRGVETTVNKAEKAKVAVYTCAVEPSATETKVRMLNLGLRV